MSMISIDEIECRADGLGAVAVETGGRWKWKGGKAGDVDDYGRSYGSSVNPPAPAPAQAPTWWYPPPQVAPSFVTAPFSWASMSPYYRTQTPSSAFGPFSAIMPYNPGNTDTILPTTGPAASSYFMSQFVDSPPGTPNYAIDLNFQSQDDSFNSGMEGIGGVPEDLEAQAQYLEATGLPQNFAIAQSMRAQAGAVRAKAAQDAAAASSGPSSQDFANIIQGAGAAAAAIMKGYQEGRVNIRQAGSSLGPITAPPQVMMVPQSSPAIPGWALGLGAAALGLVVVLAASR